MFDPTELAWAAGFFDGEGSVGAYPTWKGSSTRPRPMVQIAQTDPTVLGRFTSAVGVGRVVGPFTPKTKNSRPYWCFRTESIQNVQHIALVLWEYLSPIKKLAFRTALDTYHEWWANPTCRRGHAMKKGTNGRPYCPECRSASAYKQWSTKRGAADGT